ncbi:MAG: hypothetical protein U1E62_01385 [Alsobacter sp.]
MELRAEIPYFFWADAPITRHNMFPGQAVVTSDDNFSTAPPVDEGPATQPRLRQKVAGWLSAAITPVAARVGRDLIGGETLDDAWAVVTRLERQGLDYTLGFWDTSDYSLHDVTDVYRAALDRISDHGGKGYVSIKPPALRFDPGIARDLAARSLATNVRLHCDSHGEDQADATFRFANALAAGAAPHLVSVTIPARWTRSLSDADRMASEGVGVRIVKGQWPDLTGPGVGMEAGFLALADRLAGRGGWLAIATHDHGLLTAAVERLKRAGASFDQEFILGVARPATFAAASSNGAPVRIYVPYGKGFIPNALGTLRRNPRLALGVAMQLLPFRRKVA